LEKSSQAAGWFFGKVVRSVGTLARFPTTAGGALLRASNFPGFPQVGNAIGAVDSFAAEGFRLADHGIYKAFDKTAGAVGRMIQSTKVDNGRLLLPSQPPLPLETFDFLINLQQMISIEYNACLSTL
jgi:hypothetical protein